ncbi:MAG: hypothetical protein HZA90_02720 [Verrucomicrobia bacterium]|nr:hypothetical protein [Verrucomicrobiota bacterium]
MKKPLVLLTLCAATFTAHAQLPPMFTYQGRVTAAGTNFHGPGQFKFAVINHGDNRSHPAAAAATQTNGSLASVTITDAGWSYLTAPVVRVMDAPGYRGTGAVVFATISGGAVTGLTIQDVGQNYFMPLVVIDPPPDDYAAIALWCNSGATLADAEPDAALTLPVANGLFTVNLGDPALMHPLDPSIFASNRLWLRIWFSEDGAAFQRLRPDQPLTASPYAFTAQYALNLAGGATGNGSGLTSLNASALAAGTVADVRLSTNVALLNAHQTFTGTNTFNRANFFDGSGANGDGGSLHVGGLGGNADPKLIHFGDLQGDGTGRVSLGENGVNDTLELFASRFYFRSGKVGIGVTNPSTALEVSGRVKANAFQGADNQPLDFFANGWRVMRFEPQSNNDAPNVIAGCSGNSVTPPSFGSTIAGGGSLLFDNVNTIASTFCAIGGGAGNRIATGSGDSTIGGGTGNRIGTNSSFSTIGGGLSCAVTGAVSTISGGAWNTIHPECAYGTIGGGSDNQIAGGAWDATIGGGYRNVVSDSFATVAGGVDNKALGTRATVSGGDYNSALSWATVIAGGRGNTASNDYAMVAGGHDNVAGGAGSFAAGSYARALHDGAFVWADSRPFFFNSTAANEVSFRAQKGVRIQTDTGIHLSAADAPIIVRDFDLFAANAPASKAGIGRWGLFMEPSTLTIGIPSTDVSPRYFQVAKYSTNGNATQLLRVDQAGNLTTAGTVNGSSDRHAKERFTSVDPREILSRVTALPISEWSYKADAGTRHIGPMAQDFHTAFNVGTDDKHITMVDADGVALAAIQGLNQKFEEELATQSADLRTKDAQLKSQQLQIAELLNRLQALEQKLTPSTTR